MTALIVIGSVLLLFFLIGCIRPHIFIRVKEDLEVRVKVLFINRRVFTTKKTEPPDPELDLPQKKKKPKKKKQKKKKSKDKNKPKTKIAIMDILDMVKKLIATVFKKFKRYLRVRVYNFSVDVATGDAAKTAMLFGAVCGACSLIFDILEGAMDFRINEDADIGARCDYLSEKTRANIEVDISISVGQVVRLAFASGGVLLWELFTAKKTKKMPKQKKNEKIKENKDKKEITAAQTPERNEDNA